MNAISLVSISRYPLRSRRALVVGILMGTLWLYPAWGPPSTVAFDSSVAQPVRVVRILSSLLVWLVVPRQALSEAARTLFGVRSNEEVQGMVTLLFVSVLFCMFPLLAGFLNTSQPFFISAVMPILISVVSLIGICLLDDRTLRAWMTGIATVAFGFVVVGIATTGLGSSTYFGRDRVSFGFFHPTFSGTAVLAAALFAPLALSQWIFRQNRIVRLSLTVLYAASALNLLRLAQSRNVTIAVILCMACTMWARLVNRPGRAGLFLLILVTPLAVYAFALFGNSSNPLWARIDLLSSERLTIFQAFLVRLVSQSQGNLLLAPNNSLFTYLSSYSGFAAVESVYLSLFFNYGLISLLLFVLIMIICGVRLASTRQTALPYGVLCGVILYYALSAEGLTVSNLAVFVAFSFAVRVAVRLQPVEPHRAAKTS